MIAQKYVAISNDSKILFSIKNLGLSVNGNFKGLTGTMFFNADDLKLSEVNLSINAASIDTNNKSRDKHLVKDDYFSTAKFPLITFKSIKIVATNRVNRYLVTGNLSIKGISKEITNEVLISAKEEQLILKTNFELKRQDYKIGTKSIVLSDLVKVNLQLHLKK